MKPAYSMWCWAAITLAAAVTNLVAPQLMVSALGDGATPPDSTLMMTRLLGVVMVGYAVGYAIAAFNSDRLYMRVSVLLRASILPALLVLVALDWLPKLVLVLGLLDLIGAVWTHFELRQRNTRAPVSANPALRSIR